MLGPLDGRRRRRRDAVVGAVNCTLGWETLPGLCSSTIATAAPSATRMTAAAISPRRSHRRGTGLGMAAKISRSPRAPASSHARSWTRAQPRPRRSARPPGRVAGGPGLLDALGDADGVYLVGGAVRDLLRGDAPVDLDLVADRDIAELIAELSNSGGARRASTTASARPRSCSMPGASTSPAPAASATPIPGRCPTSSRRRSRRTCAGATSPSTPSPWGWGVPAGVSCWPCPARWTTSARGPCGSCTTRAFATIPPGCCGWPATPGGWASHRMSTPRAWPARRSATARWRRSAALVWAPSCACWPARPIRRALWRSFTASASTRRSFPGWPRPTATCWRERSSCCPPTATGPRSCWRPPRSRSPRPSWRAASTRWRSRPAPATRSSPR